MKIIGRERASGGWYVAVEYPNAYTDGTSRIEREFLADADAETREGAMDALSAIVRGRAIDLIVGQDIAEPTPTKDLWERRAEHAHATWWRWQTTRIEAQTRAMPAPVITALTNRENAAWTAYADILNAWRVAT